MKSFISSCSLLYFRCDEVQRSLELLDRVLSEFDDLENGNVSESGGSERRRRVGEEGRAQLSEDDGYMSMNGRRAKFLLDFRPVNDGGEPQLPPTPEPAGPPPTDIADFPPPPEEAERIISTLLPRYLRQEITRIICQTNIYQAFFLFKTAVLNKFIIVLFTVVIYKYIFILRVVILNGRHMYMNTNQITVKYYKYLFLEIISIFNS